jgi:hypothetical protein
MVLRISSASVLERALNVNTNACVKTIQLLITCSGNR